MNHKKFIQLLNLYVDGEANPLEAREVEREIENDPARRRIYDEYCRIQAATRLVYAQFRTAAAGAGPERAVAAGRLRAAVAQPGRVPGPPFRRVLFWTGGAAAACLALAVAFWSMPHIGPSESQIQTAESPGVSVHTVEAAPAVAAVTPASESYAAPFVAPTRGDSLVLQPGAGFVDPFSLGSGNRAPSFGDPELVLSAVPSLDASRIAPIPTSPSLDARVAEQNRKLQAILRAGFAPKNAPQAPQASENAAVPVSYQP